MAKLDKSKYTKAEIKAIRAEKRRRKLEKKFLQEDPNLTKNNILVLKHGSKYSADYVNKMYEMVLRNISLPFNFYCLTEDPTGINPGVKILDLPKRIAISGWWFKPYIFSDELPIDGTILYIDLDMVICDNIDKLFTYNPKGYCVLRDFTRSMRPNWERYNSSLIRFEKGQLDFVWQQFLKDSANIMRRHFGDQDYLWEATQGQATHWPDHWIRSWKWEVRRDRKYAPGGHKGNRTFETVEDCVAPAECCIVAFHGDPNPHKCKDPFIIDKWHKI